MWILDSKLNLLCDMTPKYFFMQKNWIKKGDAEFQVSLSNPNIVHLKKDYFVIHDDFIGFILHRELSTENNVCKVKCKDLKEVLTRRIIIPPPGETHLKIKASAESVIKKLVNDSLVNPLDEKRSYSLIEIAQDKTRGKEYNYEGRYSSLYNDLVKIARYGDLGIVLDLNLSTKKIIFDVSPGMNHSAGQNENKPVIFSIGYGNVANQYLTESNLFSKNLAIVAGQGEGVQRAIEIIGDESGFSRKEVFIDARDLNSTEKLRQRGIEKLETDYREVNSFENQILLTGPFKYKEHWNIGDIVTVQNKAWQTTQNKRVEAIVKSITEEGESLEIILGQEPFSINEIQY
jgi:hypothetical protein